MSVWYVIPSKRPIKEALSLAREWEEMGYRVMLLRDMDEFGWITKDVDLGQTQIIYRPYYGYADAVNYLTRMVLGTRDCEWIVTGGEWRRTPELDERLRGLFA